MSGRPSTVPQRLLRALHDSGGQAPSRFQLVTRADLPFNGRVNGYITALAQRGLIVIHPGPRGAHRLTLAKKFRRLNRNG